MHSNVRGRHKTALETCCQVGFFGDMLSSRFFLEELFALRLFMFSLLVAVGALARKGWRWRKRLATAWTALASLKRRSGRSGVSAQLAAGTPALGPGADIAQLY